jgi:BirA family transcriptional regulator, biotin operon repressor / biotin---[acetyl-CoA-carboxylase] ligase
MEYLLSRQAANGFDFLEQTGSTNRDLLERAGSCEEFHVLATDFQSAGRGRMDRRWEAEPGTSVMASILLRPSFLEPEGIGWLSLLAALAINQAVASFGVSPKVKWPNDVLVEGKKISGILAEASTDLSTVVLGFGINVSQGKSDLPVDTATSLFVATGKQVNRDQLLATVIQNISSLYGELASAEGNAEVSGLRQALIQASATVGQQVAVEFPDNTKAFGLAKDIDSGGRLVIETSTETLSVSAGDVLHLRST